MEQHPAPAAKHFNIAFVFQWKPGEYFISERLLAPHPGHKTIYFFTSLQFIFESIRSEAGRNAGNVRTRSLYTGGIYEYAPLTSRLS